METTEIHQTTVVDEPMTDNFSENLADQGELEAPLKTEDEYAISELTLRAIVSSKEAGVIIGKAGKNVADLRDETGVKAGVSKVVPGVHDRVLTVTGQLRSLARAYAIVAKGLLEGAPQMGMGGVVSNNGTHRKCDLFLRFLIFGFEIAFAWALERFMKVILFKACANLFQLFAF
jgi:heterogeneous nuclear rnp K-like protein 2